jgi:hypothetical protein
MLNPYTERRKHANYSADQEVLVYESVCPKRAMNINTVTKIAGPVIHPCERVAYTPRVKPQTRLQLGTRPTLGNQSLEMYKWVWKRNDCACIPNVEMACSANTQLRGDMYQRP